MHRLVMTIAALALFGCTPPAPPASTTEPAAAPTAPIAGGPYTNSWDSAEASHFRHTLGGTPGVHEVTLQAQSDASGGETVAVYPVVNGEVVTERIVFVIATIEGNSAAGTITFTHDLLAPVVVEVRVENAGGRRHAGSYTLTVAQNAQ